MTTLFLILTVGMTAYLALSFVSDMVKPLVDAAVKVWARRVVESWKSE